MSTERPSGTGASGSKRRSGRPFLLAGRIEATPEALRLFAGSLRVVVSNPTKTRAIAEAKLKTDKVDAQVLSQLLAAGFLPSVWIADDQTQALRRQVARRAHTSGSGRV